MVELSLADLFSSCSGDRWESETGEGIYREERMTDGEGQGWPIGFEWNAGEEQGLRQRLQAGVGKSHRTLLAESFFLCVSPSKPLLGSSIEALCILRFDLTAAVHGLGLRTPSIKAGLGIRSEQKKASAERVKTCGTVTHQPSSGEVEERGKKRGRERGSQPQSHITSQRRTAKAAQLARPIWPTMTSLTTPDCRFLTLKWLPRVL